MSLRRNANLSTGGSACDVTDTVHPEVAARVIEAARMVGLDVAGIDVVATRIDQPLEQTRGAIVEVNAAPGLRMHLEPSSGQGRAVGEAIKDELLKHANEEQGHADVIAERIVQLGGEPNFNPLGLTERSHAEYIEGGSLSDMVREDLVAERIAIESYTEMIRYIGDNDTTTKRMLEGILAVEEEHAEELASMLETLSGDRA